MCFSETVVMFVTAATWMTMLVIAVLAVIHPLDARADNLGREFVVVFMRNDVEYPLSIPLELFITTPRTIPVMVSIRTPKLLTPAVDITVSVVSGQVEKIEIPHELRLNWVGIENKVLYVHADNDIAIYGLNKEQFSTDGFLLYPTDVIGYEYITVSYSPTHSFTVFALASKYDNTELSIIFPDGAGRIPLRIEFLNRVFTNNDVINITLQAFQSFQCASYDQADLTGTRIVSSMPVAAFSGNVRTWVGDAQSSRDHLAVQLPPVNAYGKEFPIMPIPGRTIGDKLRVVSSLPNTDITVETYGEMTQYYFLANVSNYLEVDIASNSTTTVTSSQPVMVVQISQSQQSNEEFGDPTMIIVTATPQYLSEYVFSTPQLSRGGFYENWLVCIAKYDEVEGLMFDGSYFSLLNPVWIPIPGTVLVGTHVPITDGAHSMRHISPIARFGGIVYGTANKESYSFQIGMRLAPINQPCVTTASTFGDGIDNDCDGLIDEELCVGDHSGIDTDGDGEADEDCAINRDYTEGAPDSGGRQFILFFMENLVSSPRFFPLEIYLTPSRASMAYIQIESPRWFEPSVFQRDQVPFGEVRKLFVPYTFRESGTGQTSKALFITADEDVVVYGVNKELYSADAFLAFPTDVLGNEYYAVTHWPNSDVWSKCQLGIVGTADGTMVEIHFPVFNHRGTINVEFNGEIYGNNSTLTVVMDRFSTVQLQSQGDLTGTYIRSTKKIGVLSGNVRTAVGSGSSRDHLVAMLPPVMSWGKQYYTVPIPARSTGDFFYVLASEDDTEVKVTGRSPAVLQAGESVTIIFSSTTYAKISASNPILVTQISQSQQNSMEIGDPTMIVLPAREQWDNAYTFSTVANSDMADQEYHNYVVIAISTGQISGLLYDGKYLPDLFTTWFDVPGEEISGTSFLISSGVHTLQHIDPTVTFSVIVYGNADKESYGFPAGMRLSSINAPCERTPSLPGDRVDNDCDGKIDEEICSMESRDADGDGEFDEDCALFILPVTQPVTTAMPTTVAATGPSTTASRPVWMIMGPPGVQGVAGLPGMQGPQGVPGYNGYPGVPGRDGKDGVPGQVGAIGAIGPQGASGAVGASGATGERGEIGSTGAQGATGLTGSTGSTGPRGDPGLSIQGEPGKPGLPGPTGASGGAGDTGATGMTGERGDTGLQGAPGITGPQGPSGLKGDMGPAYHDENECETNPCSHTCINTIGSFYCDCPTGLTLDESRVSCVDDNECLKSNGGCLDDCINTAGSYYCACLKNGYEIARDNKTCIDIDECDFSKRVCADHLICINTIGSYTCMNIATDDATPNPDGSRFCAEGRVYEPDTRTCTDVDECGINNGGCVDFCQNLDGSFLCSCRSGYTLAQDFRSCIDINECLVNQDGCDSGTEICINSVGSFHCLAKSAVASKSSNLAGWDTSTLVDGNILLALLIWLVVISVLILVLMIIICKQSHDQEVLKQNHFTDLADIYRSLQPADFMQDRVPYRQLQSEFEKSASSTGSLSYA